MDNTLYTRDTHTVGSVWMGCRSVHLYERLNTIDEGTYGVVHRARSKETGQILALKSIKVDRGGAIQCFPITSLREINILLSLDHPNIVKLYEVVTGASNAVYMVMEYLEHDIKVLQEKTKLRTPEIKCLVRQLLSGVAYMHANWITHRDLKPSNVLLNNRGILKIADFGLARKFSDPPVDMTPTVVTLWYRAPEVLMGLKRYGPAIDIWSVGCIFAELVLGMPLFAGSSELEQCGSIFALLGTPNEEQWPGYTHLPFAKSFKWKKQNNILRSKFPVHSFLASGPTLSDCGFDLLSKLLDLNPEKRITASSALGHHWFDEIPKAQDPSLMPTFAERHNSKQSYLPELPKISYNIPSPVARTETETSQ